MVDLARYRREYECWLGESAPLEDFGAHVERKAMHQWLMRQLDGHAITYLEFGVHRGASMKWWADGNTHPSSRLSGFDSFHGLPDDWEAADGLKPAGWLSRAGAVPHVFDERVTFYAGWFADTLGPFFARLKSRFRIVAHIDCDCYSSSVTVFQHLTPHLKPGDYLIMDEAGYGDEMAAFIESGIHARAIACAGCAAIGRVE